MIIFANRFFHPDSSATSLLLSDLAFALAGNGFSVTVLTTRAAGRTALPRTEQVRGVTVRRVAIRHFFSSTLIGRAVEYLQCYVGLCWLMFLRVNKGDILVAKTDPPLICVPAAMVARLKGAKLVNWIQDLYPEVASELGVVSKPVARVLQRVRDAALRGAYVNVAIGDRMAAVIGSRGVCAARTEVICNWVDDQAIKPVSNVDNEFRSAIAGRDDFVVGYSGNLGRAHECDTLLGAARRLAMDGGVLFLFSARGHSLSLLMSKVKQEGLEQQFRFLPPQPLKDLNHVLAAADLHWVSLRPELEGLIVPSKFYGILAAGRPVIGIMRRDGELARLIERHECGIVVEPGDSHKLADEILRLKSDPDRCAAMGQRARALLEREFSRTSALERWVSLLSGL